MMARSSLWCFLLLFIAVGFSQAQQDPDGIIFLGPTERPAKFPLRPPQRPTLRPGITTPPSTNNGGSTTQSPAAYNQCINACLATSEYNPVCGTDNVVYSNPGRLSCAQSCGNQVQFSRYGQCPTPTNASG